MHEESVEDSNGVFCTKYASGLVIIEGLEMRSGAGQKTTTVATNSGDDNSGDDNSDSSRGTCPKCGQSKYTMRNFGVWGRHHFYCLECSAHAKWDGTIG